MGKIGKTFALILILIMALGMICVQPVKAQFTQNGEACPLVSPVNITSPSNTTYTTSVLTLTFNINSLFDNTIYQYVLVYSIDGQNNVTIPSNILSFTLPNGDTGPLTIVQCSGSVALPKLNEGTHSLTVYATFERISTNGNWPDVIYDNGTVYFAINNGIAPAITNLSIINGTYYQENLTLSYTTDKDASWVGYSLDGKENVTIHGNTMLTELSNGSHILTIYANDTFGNMSSQTVNFTVEKPQTKNSSTAITVSVIVAPIVVACIAVGLLIYRRHRKTADLKQ